jgi:hypothetical protein
MEALPPTLEEIEERCALIRATWSDEEHYKRIRADWRPVLWTAARTVRVDDNNAGIEEATNVDAWQ